MYTHPDLGLQLAHTKIEEAQSRMLPIPMLRTASLESPDTPVALRSRRRTSKRAGSTTKARHRSVAAPKTTHG